MSIGKDKWLHMFGCMALAIVIGVFTNPMVGFASATVIGAMKEARDTKTVTAILNRLFGWMGFKFESGTPSWDDFVADVAGAILGSIFVWGNEAMKGITQ